MHSTKSIEPRDFQSRCRGLTVVEVLVSVAIIGILIAVLLPATQTAREAARRMDCSNRMKQVGLAIENYVADWKFYPDGASWRYDLLPYLGETTIYQARGPISDDVFAIWEPIQALTVKVYLCPSDPADVVLQTARGTMRSAMWGFSCTNPARARWGILWRSLPTGPNCY